MFIIVVILSTSENEGRRKKLQNRKKARLTILPDGLRKQNTCAIEPTV